MFLFIIGPAGSGKSTLGRLLGQSMGLPSHSIGDIIRHWQAGGAPPTAVDTTHFQAMDWQKRGQSITRQLVKRHPQGAVIDGFPRIAWQSNWIMSLLARRDYAVIALNVPKKVCAERIRLRQRDQDDPRRTQKYARGVELAFLPSGKLLVLKPGVPEELAATALLHLSEQPLASL